MFVPAGTPPEIVKKLYDATPHGNAAAFGQGSAGTRWHGRIAVRFAR